VPGSQLLFFGVHVWAYGYVFISVLIYVYFYLVVVVQNVFYFVSGGSCVHMVGSVLLRFLFLFCGCWWGPTLFEGEDMEATGIAALSCCLLANPCPGLTVGKTGPGGGRSSRSPPILWEFDQSAYRLD
jgi:hypothetical protein